MSLWKTRTTIATATEAHNIIDYSVRKENLVKYNAIF